MNLNYGLEYTEVKEIASRARESTEAWEAVEHYFKRRLAGGIGERCKDELADRLDYILDQYVNAPKEPSEEDAFEAAELAEVYGDSGVA